MAVFTVAAALGFHHNFADQNAMAHFLKNISITGGLLQIVALNAGSFSIDSRLVMSRPSKLVRVAAETVSSVDFEPRLP